MDARRMLVLPLAASLAWPAATTVHAAQGSSPTASDVTTRASDQTIESLMTAAQRLREAIQVMAKAPAGSQRTQAVKQGNRALVEVHRAMASLPSGLLLAQADDTSYRKAMDPLQKASDRLRDAAQALAREPAGPKRNAAIRKVNEALLETNQAMLMAGRSGMDASVAGSSGAVLDQAASPAVRGPVVVVDTLKMKGKITSIDHAKRQIVVRNSEGGVAQVVAGPDIRNFDNLKVGDEVTMRYTQAQSLAVAEGSGDAAKMGEIRTKVEAEAARQSSLGGKPGVSAMERTTLVANVFGIDREKGILTLRGTNGDPVDIHVADESALKQIDLNDQVVIGYRQALAVDIEPGDMGMAGKKKP